MAPDEDVRRLTRMMNTRFTSGEKIAVGEDGGRCARGRTNWGGEETKRTTKAEGETANKAPAIHEYQRLKINCLVLRVSHARSSGQEP